MLDSAVFSILDIGYRFILFFMFTCCLITPVDGADTGIVRIASSWATHTGECDHKPYAFLYRYLFAFCVAPLGRKITTRKMVESGVLFCFMLMLPVAFALSPFFAFAFMFVLFLCAFGCYCSCVVFLFW